MGTQRTSFAKLQRDQAKKAKADAKRTRRQDRGSDSPVAEEAVLDLSGDKGGPVSASDLLQLVETLHQRFESGAVSYEEFEETKAELLSRLPID
ncbi:MAG: hypothetical protein KY454_04730 [Actinobacteria bacterium]|nr:hypothetical protein [Actinomycetota bacterium]MBW3649781.1 hypothetical protein [Actinomycetota bacterium]